MLLDIILETDFSISCSTNWVPLSSEPHPGVWSMFSFKLNFQGFAWLLFNRFKEMLSNLFCPIPFFFSSERLWLLYSLPALFVSPRKQAALTSYVLLFRQFPQLSFHGKGHSVKSNWAARDHRSLHKLKLRMPITYFSTYHLPISPTPYPSYLTSFGSPTQPASWMDLPDSSVATRPFSQVLSAVWPRLHLSSFNQWLFCSQKQ